MTACQGVRAKPTSSGAGGAAAQNQRPQEQPLPKTAMGTCQLVRRPTSYFGTEPKAQANSQKG